MSDCAALYQTLNDELGRSMFGMDEVIRGLSIALIAGGHVLLEGPPGLGKTRLSKAFAQVLGGSYKRIQGTADLMPTDLTGVHVFNTKTQEFVFQPGPLFADIVLVDEINRAGPKTQSALLEAMEERQISVERDTFALASNFLVIATQNPHEFEGTFPLPESQLDRFALCLPVAYLSREDEALVLNTYSVSQDAITTPQPQSTISEETIKLCRAEMEQVHLAPELIGYVQDITAATRESSQIELGLSMRGALSLSRCARVEAALRGADFVSPDDVMRVAPWVVPHRLVLSAEAVVEGVSAFDLVGRIMSSVTVPK